MYTDVVERPRELRRRHSVENQWDLLTALDVESPTPAANPGGDADRSRRKGDRRRTPRGGGVTAGRRSRGDSRQRQFAVPPMAARRRSSRPSPRSRRQAGRRVIVTSGPSEREAAKGIINDARGKLPAGDRHRVLDCGDFSLAELRALIERSALYIGGDSGPLHLAATTRRADRRDLRTDAVGALGALAGSRVAGRARRD